MKHQIQRGQCDHRIMPTYSITARLYDRMVGLYAFDQLRENFERMEKRYGFDLSLCGDVACGTGLFSSYLSERGAGVIGFDLSAGMLAEARERLAAKGVRLLRQDMRYLSPPRRLSLIVCATDSLNHLLSELDVRRTLGSFNSALRPGGWALFDMNTAWQLREGSDSDPWEFQIDGLPMRWLSQWKEDEGTAELRLMFPTLKGTDGMPLMEVHRERAYEARWIADELELAGFSRAEVLDATGLGKPGAKTRRLQLVAVK
jgi:SAM-dependent methyltransferase